MKSISVKSFCIWTSDSGDISYPELWWASCLVPLDNLSRGHYEERFCEIILNLDQWLRKWRCKY